MVRLVDSSLVEISAKKKAIPFVCVKVFSDREIETCKNHGTTYMDVQKRKYRICCLLVVDDGGRFR